MSGALFVCVQNTGRSQMAETIFNRIAEERDLDARALSAGTGPAGPGGMSIHEVGEVRDTIRQCAEGLDRVSVTPSPARPSRRPSQDPYDPGVIGGFVRTQGFSQDYFEVGQRFLLSFRRLGPGNLAGSYHCSSTAPPTSIGANGVYWESSKFRWAVAS